MVGDYIFYTMIGVLNSITNVTKKFLKKAIDIPRQKAAEKQQIRELTDSLGGLSDLISQTNSYNETIPIVFGSAKLAGNVIWVGNMKAFVHQDGGISYSDTLYDVTVNSVLSAGPLQLKPETKASDKTDSWTKTRSTVAEFFQIYKLDFAIAICEGEIDEMLSVQANGRELDLSKYTYRIYNGSEQQGVDPVIAQKEGEGKAPAFKGICYIVFEQFPISDFNNLIPNFTFSVRSSASKNSDTVNEKIKGITLIPGTGEFVYHTKKVTKYNIRGTSSGDILMQETAFPMNYNNNTQNTNVIVALDNLKKQLPKLEWISLVVCWFADNTDVALSSVYPACEFNEFDRVSHPYKWSVKGVIRQYSRVVGKDVEGNLRYGGTPSDDSIVELLKELKLRGYKVHLLPMLMMDIEGKPWRGRMTGSASSIHNFFHKADGYNAFIKHYAELTKGYIDAMSVGTEMVGLTKINDGQNQFPAVDEFSNLVDDIRAIVGSNVKLTYAADWSEYHHTEGGFYNMDKLWANPNIDFIGIDAYFPLTNTTVKPNIGEIKKGWHSGEGWEYYYNQDRTETLPLSQEWAWKNIRWFVENNHRNSDGTSTPWEPNMKKVWFIEYGFPSVDLCTNQPNVFYDPTSSESALPRESQGHVDFESQTNAIIATEDYWSANADIVENKFIWTWDARPYPFFPNLTEVWSDCKNWQYGHWVNGKIMNSYIKDIVLLIFERAGIENFHTESLDGIVHGMVLKGNYTGKSVLQNLSMLYNFRVFEKDGGIFAKGIKFLEKVEIDKQEILLDEEEVEILNSQFTEKTSIRRLNIQFYDIKKDDTVNHIYFEDPSHIDGTEKTISLPFILSSFQAEEIARKGLRILNSTKFQTIVLPAKNKYLQIHGGMIIGFSKQSFYGIVESITHDNNRVILEIIRISQDILEEFSININADVEVAPASVLEIQKNTTVEIIDTNNFMNISQQEGTFMLWFAFANVSKQGLAFFYSTNENGNYNKMFEVYNNSTVGQVVSNTQLPIHGHTVDEINKFEVLLYNTNTLDSITRNEFLGGENLCLIGNEIINFQNSSNKGGNLFEISNLLRGRYGTQIEEEIEGKRFVLLQKNLQKFSFTEALHTIYFKTVLYGDDIDAIQPIMFASQKKSITPWKVDSVSKIMQVNGDILISWNEQAQVKSNFFAISKTHIKHFQINIGNVRSEFVNGVNKFLYTSAMQAEDSYVDNFNITVQEL